MRRTAPAALALATIAGALLVGCTPEPPAETTPPPTAEPTPAAISADEARTSWDAYQSRLSELGAEPESATLDALLDVAGSDLAQIQLENMRMAEERRVHIEGARQTTAFVMLRDAEVPSAAICVDVSDERVMGDEGEEIETETPRTTLSRTAEFAELDGSVRVVDELPFDGPAELDPCG